MINNILADDMTRYLLLILTSVFAGYTLQPVPKALNNLFDNSQIFKFVVLFTVGCVAFYPVDHDKLVKITVSCLLLLLIFESLRGKNI